MAITTTLTEAGHTVIERNAQEDANRQLEQVNDCIAQGVEGIIVIPQDGESAMTIVETAQENDVPIAVFNRPPSDLSAASSWWPTMPRSPGRPSTSWPRGHGADHRPPDPAAHHRGRLGDPNAVGRRDGFYEAISAYGDKFATPIEVASEWDAATALANLEAAVTANPEIDLIFTSSDFLFPTIRSVLEPRGMWAPRGEEGHVLMGGLDGDATACQLIKDGYVDATGVQDLYFEAESAMTAILAAVEAGEAQPNQVIEDPGFALTADNIGEREMDMWGCVLLSEGFLNQ
jgi:inositol transport system substrate-binding protein